MMPRMPYLTRAAVLPAVAGLAMLFMSAGGAFAQATSRAEPVTGAGVVTIGGIPTNGRVNVHFGPGPLFPVIGGLGYGTRVQKGACFSGGQNSWCQVDAFDGSASGFVQARFLVEGATGGAREPDYWVVKGLPAGSRLNVRRAPAASAPALATLRENEVVQNRGCRNTANGRWCSIRSIIGMDVTGWVSARYLRESRGPVEIQPPVSPPVRPPVAGGGLDMHGPDFYVVTGLPAGDQLNVRSQPSAQSTILGRVSQGTRLRNLGCQSGGQSRWCRVETTGSVVITGWVAGRYLRE